MTPHPLQEHTHENAPHSQVPNWLQHGWIFLEQLLLDCPAVCCLRWHGKDTGTADTHCGLPQALVGTALGQPTEQLGTRKSSEEGEGAEVQSNSEQSETGCNGLCDQSQSWGPLGHPLLAGTWGCPQEPPQHCPRSPAAPAERHNSAHSLQKSVRRDTT